MTFVVSADTGYLGPKRASTEDDGEGASRRVGGVGGRVHVADAEGTPRAVDHVDARAVEETVVEKDRLTGTGLEEEAVLVAGIERFLLRRDRVPSCGEEAPLMAPRDRLDAAVLHRGVVECGPDRHDRVAIQVPLRAAVLVVG